MFFCTSRPPSWLPKDFELHTFIYSFFFFLQQTVKDKELELVDSVWMFVVYVVCCVYCFHTPSLPPPPGSGTPAVKASTVGLRDPQLCALHPLMNNKTHSWIIDADFCTQSAGAIIQMCDGSGLGLTDQMDPRSAARPPSCDDRAIIWAELKGYRQIFIWMRPIFCFCCVQWNVSCPWWTHPLSKGGGGQMLVPPPLRKVTGQTASNLHLPS